MKNTLALVILLILGLIISLSSCKEKNPPTTNQLYEILYDDALNGWVKQVEFIESDLQLNFDCERNLSRKIVPSQNNIWEYNNEGDTIINELNSRQKILYVLDESNRVQQYISLVDNGKEWYTHYKENWKLDTNNNLVEKQIESFTAKDKPYFIFKEIYQYIEDGKVEILKYGKDEGSKTENGLLRTETRLANEKGDWIVIEELDEDGIPFRKSNLSYQYDPKGNWTECIIRDENNYTGESSIDTIQRKITYYSFNECK